MRRPSTRPQSELDFATRPTRDFPAYFGLLRFSRGWLTCALALLWVGLVLSPLVFLMSALGSGPVTFDVLGIPIGQLPRPWLCVVAAAMFMLLLWQHRVLVSPRVWRLFCPEQAPANKAMQPTGAPSGAGG